MFVPLHTKSEHSPGYGTASVEALTQRAGDSGLSAVGLTDVENLYGQVKFHHAARVAQVKAITGVELREGYGPRTLGSKKGRLVLIARDRVGYETLCRIITARRTASPPTGLPLATLALMPRGVFFLSDDPSVIATLRMTAIHPEAIRFLALPGIAPPAGIRAVADPDVVMLDPEDQPLHRLLVAIRLQKPVWECTQAEPAERSLPPLAALEAAYRDRPEALAETQRIAEACTLDLTQAHRVLPAYELPTGTSADDELAALVWPRLREGRAHGRWRPRVYERRLGHELEVLRTLSLASYFLIVAEIANHAHAEGIGLAVRGSAAGSLVAHVLGISQVDPIEHRLAFERFIHTERAEFPDIDLDVASDRREELLEWTLKRFGADRTAMVSTHQRFQRRSAFREGLKALGISRNEIDAFCRALPPDDQDEWQRPPLSSLPPAARPAAGLIERLIGRPHHLSVHPGGIVVADGPIFRYAPLELAPKGVWVTQYDLRSLEKLGLLKIDVLGNRALAALEQAAQLLGRPVEPPDGDHATLAALKSGNTIGCFQVETPAVRSTLRKLPLKGIADLAAALAIVRPGPASGEAKRAFIRRANGMEPPTPPHPRLEELLRQTHGLVLYDEDLMAVIAAVTGTSLAVADRMRARVIAGDAPDAIEFEFVERARANGFPEHEARAVWQLVERFAAYSFSRGHAISYAQLAWRSAWLKVHHPAEFACAVLNHYGGAYPLRSLGADFVRNGVRLLAPDVNRSQVQAHLDEGAVRMGLGMVRHLARKNVDALLQARPFADLRDLLARVPISLRELRALVLCGACDALAPLDPDAYPVAHRELLQRLETEGPAAIDSFVLRSAGGPRAPTYRALVRIKNELELLGLHLTAHPMEVLRLEARGLRCEEIGSLPQQVDRFVRIAGMVAATRRVAAGDGAPMQFVTVEDETGLVEAVLFSGVYAALGDPVNNPGPFLIEGKVTDDHGDVALTVTGVRPFPFFH